MGRVAVVATLDTKGREAAFLKERVEQTGAGAMVIDVGVKGEPACVADVSRDEVAKGAGTRIEDLIAKDDRGYAVGVMGQGLKAVLTGLVEAGKVQAVLGIGGSGGTSIVATACQGLPVGVGKLIVSTLASGQTRPYVGTKDIMLMYSVVDIEGLNKISIPILTNAAAAAAAMANARPPDVEAKPLIGMTMFGVTTTCVKQAEAILTRAGYESVVFHAVGSGGQTFEALIEDGFFAGVLDITTTEWCDELVGGILSAGPDRLNAAVRTGLPQVVCPGALDMVNFGPMDSVPARFQSRNLYAHNPQVTLMRTTPEENRQLGRILAGKLNAATGPAAVFLPLRGVSAIDAAGRPFDDPEARAALFTAIREDLDTRRVELVELDNHINDPTFSTAIAEKLLSYLER